MLDGYPRAAVVGTLTGLALLAPGCGGDSNPHPERVQPPTITGPAPSKSYPGTLHCTAKAIRNWAAPDPRFDAGRAAEQLGVDPDQIYAGRMGSAVCREAIRADQAAVGSRAIIEGVGAVCLVIATESKPVEGKTYHELLAICAAPYGAKPPQEV